MFCSSPHSFREAALLCDLSQVECLPNKTKRVSFLPSPAHHPISLARQWQRKFTAWLFLLNWQNLSKAKYSIVHSLPLYPLDTNTLGVYERMGVGILTHT